MKKVFILEGLDCANCAEKTERAVSKVIGIKNVTVNFLTTKLTFETESYDEDIDSAVKKAIKKAVPDVNPVNIM